MVAVPREYSEASILGNKVTKPCEVNGNGALCNQFSYASIRKPQFVTVEPETGYIITRDRGRIQTQTFSDQEVLKQLDFNAMALLNKKQVRDFAENVDYKLEKDESFDSIACLYAKCILSVKCLLPFLAIAL